ncbi:type VI secretion system contractile sheath protein TssC [uncultured Alistipes sp.]|uniref:type VI secretion system contractile sheath protein TssC n=1 Tax=uncultured Alistipes sp. TaxID=538949 RepID=UPI00280553DA|nr:type VI secretion system contractile sheath protein TssC [uncultured Alistipes sp.]
MATEEQKKVVTHAESAEFSDKAQAKKPAELLQESIAGLDKFGGFQLLKGLVKGVENMDPRRKAVKNIFMSDSVYAEARKKLKNELSLWVKILEAGGTDPMAIIESCRTECDRAERNLKDNLFTLHDEIRNLEITYRALDSFFANAGQEKIDCLTLMNVNRDELQDHDSDDTAAVRNELEQYYDRLSLKNNYSMLVVPGYLGDADNVRMWAQTAYRNKVLVVTDFKDSQNFQMLKEELDDASLQGQDACLANVIMTCNYILGRRKSELAGEDDDVYIPASAALAGKMSNTEEIVIAQGAAGKKYGTLNNVKGARMDLRKSEIAALIDEGVIPMVEEDGRTMAFSNRSLYNGATMGLQEYPIVRVFDWIGKVFQNFFNDEAFINWNSQVKGELQQAIHDFLSDYKGPGKLIENYNLKGINQDPKTKDISIQVEMKPFFAAKNFLIELTGHNGTAGIDWEQNVQ